MIHFTSNLNREHIQAALQTVSPMCKVKRNTGYDDDSDVEDTRADIKCMHVEDASN